MQNVIRMSLNETKMQKAYKATTQLQKRRSSVISCRTTAHQRCIAERLRCRADRVDGG